MEGDRACYGTTALIHWVLVFTNMGRMGRIKTCFRNFLPARAHGKYVEIGFMRPMRPNRSGKYHKQGTCLGAFVGHIWDAWDA